MVTESFRITLYKPREKPGQIGVGRQRTPHTLKNVTDKLLDVFEKY